MTTHTVIRNFFALSGVQIVNYLVPIVIVPLSIQIIGLDQFGRVALLQSLVWILTSIAEFGFTTSGARQVAFDSSRLETLSQTVSQLLIIRLLFFAGMCLLIFFTRVSFNESWITTSELLAVILSVLGNTLNPSWFHQGIQKMEFITFWNAVAKLIYLIFVVLLVKQVNDYLLIIFLYGFINTLVASIIIYFIFNKYAIRFIWPNWKNLRNQFSIALPLFLPNLSSSIILGGNPTLLFFFGSGQNLGEFGVVEKISIALWQIASSFNQASFPHVCKLSSNYPPRYLFQRFYLKIYVPFLVLFFVIIVFVIIFNSEINSLILRTESLIADEMLLKIVWVPFLITLNIPANQMLLALSADRTYQRVFLVTLLVFILSGFFLTKQFSADGTIFSMLLTQMTLTSLLYFSLFNLLAKRK